jgi:carbon starvation protein
VSFALTTLDSATRLLRFNVSEMGETLGWSWLGNRYGASIVAVLVIAFFAFYEVDGRPAGLALWQLFGTVNQLLAGLALLVVTLYLHQRGRNPWFTGLPMLFMMGSTLLAMVTNLRSFLAQWGTGGAMLFAVGSVLLVLAVWLAVEAVLALRRSRREGPRPGLEIGVP